MPSKTSGGTLALNKRARFDYEILETLGTGIELLGHEVKSTKAKRCSLTGSFVHLRGGEAWLTNATIPPYEKAGRLEGYEPTRSRRLLLRKSELARLAGKHDTERLTIIPLRLFAHRGLIKVEIALVRGKRVFEKRATIKRREDERRMRTAQMR
ncbi:MAG: SsrA-binding protein SmpB [bacterium]|nr:SsrA-binding protein SmpB [bacterium]